MGDDSSACSCSAAACLFWPKGVGSCQSFPCLATTRDRDFKDTTRPFDVYPAAQSDHFSRYTIHSPIKEHKMTAAKIQILPLRRALAPLKPVRRKTESPNSSSDSQAPPVRRERVSNPKVRTGCLTCKIRRVQPASRLVGVLPLFTAPHC